MIAFHDDYFERMDGVELFTDALKAHGIGKVFQLQEFGPPEPEYEIELSIFVPAYGSGGELFKKNWTEWDQRTYKGPYSTGDLRGTWDTK